MEDRKPMKIISTAKLVDLAIRQRALLLHLCRRRKLSVPATDAIDLESIPAETVEAVRWAEKAIYKGNP